MHIHVLHMLMYLETPVLSVHSSHRQSLVVEGLVNSTAPHPARLAATDVDVLE